MVIKQESCYGLVGDGVGTIKCPGRWAALSVAILKQLPMRISAVFSPPLELTTLTQNMCANWKDVEDKNPWKDYRY